MASHKKPHDPETKLKAMRKRYDSASDAAAKDRAPSPPVIHVVASPSGQRK